MICKLESNIFNGVESSTATKLLKLNDTKIYRRCDQWHHIVALPGKDVRVHLTSSHWMPYKPANFCWDGRSVSVYTRIPIFLCFASRLLNKPRVACHHGDWRVYTPSFLGVPVVPVVTVGWPRTKGTASNEWVHSFCGFLPNPCIQDLCLWCTSQQFVKTDLYPLSQGLWSLSGCRLFDQALVDNRPLLRSLPTV